MSRYFVITLVLFAFLMISGCSKELPKTYGVYVVEGNRITELNAENDIPNLDFTANAMVLVFDKALSSNHIGTTIPLNKILSIHERAHQRLNVTKTISRDKKNTNLSITPAGNLITLDEPIDVKYMPENNNNEMVYAIPKNKLSSGLYIVRFNNKEYTFGIGLGVSFENENLRCFDKHIVATKRSSKAFSWDDWFTLTQKRPKQTSSGDFIDQEGIKDCALINDEKKTWAEGFHTFIENQDFDNAIKTVDLITHINAEDADKLNAILIEALSKKASKLYEEENWKDSYQLATLAIKHGDETQEIKDISNKANHEIQEIKRKKEELYQALLKKSSTPSIINHEGKVSQCTSSSNYSNNLIISDVSIESSSYCNIKGVHKIWFGNIYSYSLNTIWGAIEVKYYDPAAGRNMTSLFITRPKEELENHFRIFDESYKSWSRNYPSLIASKTLVTLTTASGLNARALSNDRSDIKNRTPTTPLPAAFRTIFSEYLDKKDKKALALALDANGRGAWGEAYNFSSQNQANVSAISQCNRNLSKYKVVTECRLYAVGNDVVWPSTITETPSLSSDSFTVINKMDTVSNERARIALEQYIPIMQKK